MPYRLATPLCLPVFPGCQILSVCRFSQRIIGAITSSTLEGLTSGLRITHPTIPLKRCSLAVSTENWCRRLDLNQRIPPGAVLCLLSYVCKCPVLDTSLRGARGPVPNRNCTGASRASTSCRRRAAFAGRSLYIYGALAETHHPKCSPPWCRRLEMPPTPRVIGRGLDVCI